jgi:release factor glutamine methyltransferase
MYEALHEAYREFQDSGVEDPLGETLHLVDIISGGALREVDQDGVKSFLGQNGASLRRVVEARRKGIPLEYIIGRAVFAGLCLYCSEDTLIPTEWTTQLVEVAVDVLRKRQKTRRAQIVLEIGTGCGNAAILLARRTEAVQILASDVSGGAVAIARRNVEGFGLVDRISLFCGDLCSPFLGSEYEGEIDVVVCNPPYIPTGSLSGLPAAVTEYEPLIALDGGPYGIDFYRRLVADSMKVLRSGGALVFEVGSGQENLVVRLLERNGHYGCTQYQQGPGGQAGVITTIYSG